MPASTLPNQLLLRRVRGLAPLSTRGEGGGGTERAACLGDHLHWRARVDVTAATADTYSVTHMWCQETEYGRESINVLRSTKIPQLVVYDELQSFRDVDAA